MFLFFWIVLLILYEFADTENDYTTYEFPLIINTS